MTQHTDEVQTRIEKVERMKALGVIPYAASFDKKNAISSLGSFDVSKFREIETIIASPINNVKTAGRVVLFRSFGKISFAKIQDASGEIQIMFSRENCSIVTSDGLKTQLSEEVSAYKFMEKLVGMGDFIGVEGELFLTHKGELTVFVSAFTFLSKAIRPLPEKFHGLKDEETLYRQRYLDLITNNDTYNRFLLRSRFIKVMRDFYEEEGFIELETPILGNSASGAAAAPFITHHNDYDLDVFLRISPETALKKATVGRFERVFEIARDFRNEGSDPSHLQEFTMVEHYAAYWNYEDNMRFIEKMINSLFERLKLEKTVKIKDRDGVIQDVNFGTTWERIDYMKRIQEVTGIDIGKYEPGDEEVFRKILKERKITIEGMEKMGLTTLIDYFYKKLVRPKITGPAFLYNYPKYMQPLARTSDQFPGIVEQFQVVVNGWEIIKSYSELVDPIDQRRRFEEQSQAAAAGDEEATSADYDFVLAMEYAMPPQSGLGFGIDRFLTLIMGQENLRDVVLFPLIKPKNE
ncbi:MAG: lysine--tRNA ligase [Candidatus Gracilibacteria bacterium]|nr:lysine--tRNA ligase [Candidatus Gracilibacteria bacterium]